MRIVAWNCQMAFSKKLEAFHSLKADLAVISECSKKSTLELQSHGYQALWFGTNPHKGIAVLCKDAWSMETIQAPEQPWIVPIRVKTGAIDFTLIAVWACTQGNTKVAQYIGLIYQALSTHPEWFSQGPVVIAGDWNSNQIWDSERLVGNHSDVVRLLEQKGIVSSYHRHFGETHGGEKRATLYLFRHQNKPYHIDYIFVPEDWILKLQSVHIGEFDIWSKHSDHSPIIVDFHG
jgi:exonuclease III